MTNWGRKTCEIVKHPIFFNDTLLYGYSSKHYSWPSIITMLQFVKNVQNYQKQAKKMLEADYYWFSNAISNMYLWLFWYLN